MEQFELYLPQVPGVIDRARETYDVVVVNTGSFWTEAHLQMMECSSNTLFLMDQRPTSVKAVQRALELCSRCGVAAHPFLFAVNRCTRNSLLSAVDVSCALNGATVAELKDGGRAVAELAGSGLAARLVEERNDLCLSLNELLGKVIPAALSGSDVEAALEAKGRGRGKRSPFRKKRRVA
jgi:pilus assembly protein CpaE